MKIPFLNLSAQHEPIREPIEAAIREVADLNAFASGPIVAKFEEEFAAFCGARYAVGVGSGTDALWLTLLALGIGAGDEVITVPNTFIATAEAITFTGARPAFVDVDEQTSTLDPSLLEQAITPRTKAIIPVHLFGQMADMDPIMEVARRHGLYLIEDACQAHGAQYKGRAAGSIGDAGCFSFYPGKNLGAWGEAGAVVISNPELMQRIRMLRDHGQERKYHHKCIGWNARMDGIQAAVLRVKLPYLHAWNNRRHEHAHRYSERLSALDRAILPYEGRERSHVYHLYPIRIKERDGLLTHLVEKGIGCGIHYPIPLHLQEAYRLLGYFPGSFPVSERCAAEILSLPIYPELTVEQRDTVCAEIETFLQDHKQLCAPAIGTAMAVQWEARI